MSEPQEPDHGEGVGQRLSVLLDRALAEQVVEQHALSETLVGLRSALEQLRDEVGDARRAATEGAEGDDVDVDLVLGRRLAPVVERLDDLGATVEDAAADVRRHGEASGRALREAVRELTEQVPLATAVEVDRRLDSTMTRGTDAVLEALEGVGGEVRELGPGLDRRLDVLEDRVSQRVDDAVYALADVLLRRRDGLLGAAALTPAGALPGALRAEDAGRQPAVAAAPAALGPSDPPPASDASPDGHVGPEESVPDDSAHGLAPRAQEDPAPGAQDDPAVPSQTPPTTGSAATPVPDALVPSGTTARPGTPGSTSVGGGSSTPRVVARRPTASPSQRSDSRQAAPAVRVPTARPAATPGGPVSAWWNRRRTRARGGAGS